MKQPYETIELDVILFAGRDIVTESPLRNEDYENYDAKWTNGGQNG